MKELLQAIKKKEVPHNMLEEFYDFEMPFYDDCLIVQIHDYRQTGVKPKDDTNSTGEGGTSAFSIHNYNNFITPSPFAPFPTAKPDSKPAPANAQNKDGDTKEDKENMPAPGQNGASNKQPGNARIYTVVLFPTPQSHLADLQILVNTPATDTAALKRMQAQGRAAGMPPTPLTAVPPTPTFPNEPNPKRQKMKLDDSNIHEWEAELLNATCPPLYLEPTKSFAESLAIMDTITHPNNKNPAPPRKTRKRTTAELAADEAEAQGLQRFMLAGDEYQATMTATASGNDGNAVREAANSQTFSRFKAIATIRANHEEADRRKKEEDAQLAQAKRQKQMEAEMQRKREAENRQQAEVAERQQQALRQQVQHQAQLQQNQLQQNQLQQNEALRAAAAAQHQMSNAAAAQVSQTPQSATQSQFSPVPRQQTPMTAAAASPKPHPMGGTAMVATASNQAMNSPARPPSAVSQHPNQMARSVSQQQNPSRTGTPHMVQGTPVMNPSMPNRNMTPTPSRMNQTSPSMMQGGTPMMMQTPQPGQNVTPEAMNQFNQQQRMLQQQRLQQLQQQGGSPGNAQQMQTLAFSKATQQIQAQGGVPQGQNPATYRQQLAAHIFRQMQQQQQQQQQMAMQNMSPSGGIPQNNGMPQQGMTFANLNLQQMRAKYMQHKQNVIQNYGTQNIPSHIMAQIKQMEMQIQQREAREQQAMQSAHMQNGMGGQMNSQQMMAQNSQPGNSMQMQQYQQMLQQQRQQQEQQRRVLVMRQQAMASGGQLPQGMMGGMQGMNMAQMNGMQMGQMQGGMQAVGGMQGMNMNNMSPANQQQMQQMFMMRQAQQQAQRMGGQPQGDGGMGWSGV
jgi:transcription factor SPT20